MYNRNSFFEKYNKMVVTSNFILKTDSETNKIVNIRFIKDEDIIWKDYNELPFNILEKMWKHKFSNCKHSFLNHINLYDLVVVDNVAYTKNLEKDKKICNSFMKLVAYSDFVYLTEENKIFKNRFGYQS